MALFPAASAGTTSCAAGSTAKTCSSAIPMTSISGNMPSDLITPKYPWELMQIGNCGSPIETPEGWLLLTHGVGPMRSYAIGAMLLDLDDPLKVIGHLREPLIAPLGDEREGYVPNVVYTCGAMVHGDQLLIPYAQADKSTGISVVDLPRLIERLVDGGQG